MLETQRLILRKWTEDDADSLFDMPKIRKLVLLQAGRPIKM